MLIEASALPATLAGGAHIRTQKEDDASPLARDARVERAIWPGSARRHNTNRMALEKDVKTEVITEHQTHEGDTGSPEVQVALLSKRLQELTAHLGANKHDYSSRRGLMKMVGQRRRMLKYLNRTDPERYRALLAKLGLRR